MRQVLIEAARRRYADKRNAAVVVAFDDVAEGTPPFAKDLLALDQALAELERMHPRQAAVVECRFFAGLEIGETAALLNLSEATIHRDWRAAKAWLTLELNRSK
jgi:RNA polymerase sigma factor (TIGR02999 family)